MNTAANGHPHRHSMGPSVDQPTSPGILVETLQRHPVIILGTMVVTLVGAYFYLDRVTPRYTGTSRVYVDQQIPKVLKESEEGFMTRQDNYLYTQAEVIRSNPVLTKALNALKDKPMQMFANATDALSILQGGVSASVGKTDGIINISFKSPEPAEAAEIVNAVVDAYVAFHAEKKRDRAATLLKILEEALAHRDADIAKKYEALLAFKKENENLAFGSDQTNNIIMRQMEKLLNQLSEAKVATSQAKHFYQSAQGLSDDPQSLRRLLEAWRAQNTNYTPAQKIMSPQPDRQFVENQVGVLEQEYLAAKQREEELAAQCETQRQQVLLLDAQSAQYARLLSAYDEAKTPSDTLEDRIEELSVTEGVGGLTVTVLERAMPANSPSEPQKARVMAIALLLGMCGGVGLGMVRELSDQRLRSSREISALLRLPILGAIPTIKSPLRSGILRARMVRICPTSFEAEAFRRLRTPLLFSAFNEKARTILITSPASGDGKTTVVSNLGLALARAGQRVLIIDADCHAPRQHLIFKKDRQEKGLSLILAGRMSPDEAIEATTTDRLDILTCGPTVANTTEMLNGSELRKLMVTLAARYDRVLVDSSPVLSCTDAQALAAQCEGVVVVLRAEVSTRKDSVQTCAELADVGGHILGIVVNGTPAKRTDYRYNGYYSGSHSVKSVAASEGRVESGQNVSVEVLPGR